MFHPLERKRTASGVIIPVLMYHSISAVANESAAGYFGTTTSPSRFEEQMRFLHENGYSTLSLEEVQHRLANSSDQTRPVVITFDDGFEDFYTDAFPILEQYGFSATMFLPTGYIGNSNLKFKDKFCLSWGQVCELSAIGQRFGSHTVSHPQLRQIIPADRIRELQESKNGIEQALGKPVNSFSYPYAFPEQDRQFVRELRQDLSECGYTNGVSTIVGRASASDDPFFFKRLPINDGDDCELFRAKLEGGYDWLHPLQYATKLIRSEIQNWQQ